jgi:hypothetical protein
MAEAQRALAVLDGRVAEQSRTVDGPDVPLAGSVVRLMPDSPAVVAEGERIKAGARESQRAYRQADAQLKRLHDYYEQALWEAGAADLVRTTVIGPDGSFSFSDVPAGGWIVLARHEVPSQGARRPKVRDREAFAMRRTVTGYGTSRIWMMRVTLGPGAPARVEFTDRNVWLSGIVEEEIK